jgi:hypothetical protein
VTPTVLYTVALRVFNSNRSRCSGEDVKGVSLNEVEGAATLRRLGVCCYLFISPADVRRGRTVTAQGYGNSDVVLVVADLRVADTTSCGGASMPRTVPDGVLNIAINSLLTSQYGIRG